MNAQTLQLTQELQPESFDDRVRSKLANPERSSKFDPHGSVDEVLRDVGMSIADGGGKLTFYGHRSESIFYKKVPSRVSEDLLRPVACTGSFLRWEFGLGKEQLWARPRHVDRAVHDELHRSDHCHQSYV
jgi:hypothetical protein